MKLEPPIPAAALAAIRAPFLEARAELLDAPTVQPLGQLLDVAGEALRERLFVLQGEGGEEACLRPDFTIPAVRAHNAAGARPGRFFYEGHAFRVAPAGASRAEEFLQIGVEVFESGDAALADAEIVSLAWRSAQAGGRRDLTLLFGDVALFSAFIGSHGLPAAVCSRLERSFSSPRRLAAELAQAEAPPAPKAADRLAVLLGHVSESEAAAALEEIWRISEIEPVGGRSALEIVHRLREQAAIAASPHLTRAQADPIVRFLAVNDRPRAALRSITDLAGSKNERLAEGCRQWDRRLEALESLGVPAAATTFSAAFGRAFGYYDGMLFEIRSASLGPDQPVGAGGRYDRLPARLGGASASGAVGCMVRPGRAWSDAGA
jgi:ATP phosphoribosyltransferase regulatory subunit